MYLINLFAKTIIIYYDYFIKMSKINKNNKIENIRHSLAHILASAVLQIFPKAKLGIGPTIENGFYYDFLLPRKLNEEDLKQIEKLMQELVLKKFGI